MSTLSDTQSSTKPLRVSNWQWRSLRMQFLRQLLWPLILAFIISAAVMAANNYRETASRQTQWRQQMLETFSKALAKPLWDCDDATARGIAQTLAQMPMVQSVQLQNLCADEQVEIGRIDTSLSDDNAQGSNTEVPRLLQTSIGYWDESQRRFTVGHLRLQFEPISVLRTSARDLAEQIGIFAVILLALFTMVALAFRRTIERPLTRLHQAMQQQQTVADAGLPDKKLHDELTDVTAVYNRLLQELQSQAQHDALTGLGNRKVLEQQLQLAIAQSTQARTDLQGYVMLLDLDGFKPINDTYGHAAGDFVLQTVAQRLRDVTRSSDTVTRLGGDEFVIIANDYPGENGMVHILERISQAVEAPQHYNGHTFRIGASIGYARIPQDGISCEALLAHADQAMYQAKQMRKASPISALNTTAHPQSADTLYSQARHFVPTEGLKNTSC